VALDQLIAHFADAEKDLGDRAAISSGRLTGFLESASFTGVSVGNQIRT
jgi:hypothetical protein